MPDDPRPSKPVLPGDDQQRVYQHERADWTAQYAAIGEFAVEFERLCDEIRFVLRMILRHNGLDDGRFSMAVFGAKSMTAEPLREQFLARAHMHAGGDKILLQLIDDINQKLQELVKVRNDYLHGTWHIGPDIVEVSDNPEPSELMGIRTKLGKGLHSKRLPSTIAKLRSDSQGIRDLRALVRKVVWEVRRLGPLARRVPLT